MSNFPYTFTFYSYKGGVGRSMAVLNTAYQLASFGKQVLILDLDLEAPGVTSFLDRNDELEPLDSTRHPLDILSLLSEIIERVGEDLTPQEVAKKITPLDQFLRSVRPEKLDELKPKYGQVGRVDVVAADSERNWCERLARLSLNRLTQEGLIQASKILREYLKSYRFEHRPLGFEEKDESLQIPYDYILVDSRTGITEIGGLCVGPLADRLVVLCGLNDQNVHGTLDFLKVAGIEPKGRSKDSDPWDTADEPEGTERPPSLGPKPTLLVASPVPNGEIHEKKKRLKEMSKKFGIRPLRLSYHPQMALMETVFVRDYQDEYLAREYLDLTQRLTAQVGDHPSQLLQGFDKLPLNERIERVLRALPQDRELFHSVLLILANDLDPESDEDFLWAGRVYATIATVFEFRSTALYNWGNALCEQAKTKQGADADSLFELSYEKFRLALEIQPDKHEALNNWGTALSDQAKTKLGADADSLFELSYEKYRLALEIQPDKHEALNNWGSALSEQAKTKQVADADSLFELSYEKYGRALEIKPDKLEALNNWGVALSDQAKTKEDSQRASILKEGIEKLLAAEAISEGSASFNLACLSSLQSNLEQTLHWLDKAQFHGDKLTRKKIADDEDFDSVREHPNFISFVEKLPEG